MFQGSLFPPECDWKAPRLADLPQDWNVFPRIAYDVETRDELLTKLGPGVRRGAYIVGFCLGFEGRAGGLVQRQGFYLPIRHLGGGNCDEGPEAIIAYVKAQAAAYRGEVVGAKLDYDLDHSAEIGIEFSPAVRFKDVQVLEPLLDELQYTYGLDAILARHGLEPKDERVLQMAADALLDKAQRKQNIKSHLWRFPGQYVGEYGERDVLAPLELIERQELQVEKRGLHKIWELEQLVTPILVKMRRRGVRVDMDHLDRMRQFAVDQEAAAWTELHRLTGVQIKVGDAMKAEVVNQALEAADIVAPRNGKGGASITADWLEALDHPAGALIRRARKMNNLRTTFVSSVEEHQVRGRIHCTFNQVVRQKDEGGGTEGVAYGRLSAVDPNLQNQPARDPEIGPMWRKVYVPDEGGEWCSNDYSQQEPRLAVHAAVSSGASRIGDRGHQSAMTAAAAYHNNPDTDAHDMFCTMVHPDYPTWPKDGPLRVGRKQTRTIYKNVYLGICYGEGEPKMCRELGLPTQMVWLERQQRWTEVAGEEGKRVLQLIDEKVPYVKATARAIEKVAKQRGYIITVMGRQLHFPKDQHGNYDYTHKAFNRFIQGSAADQTKKAMVDLDAAGFPLQLQIHDELAWTVHGGREEGRRGAAIMEQCFPLHVPSKCDTEIGPSWGEAK